MGAAMLANGLEGLSAVSLAVLTRAFGMSIETIEEMLVDVRRDMADRKLTFFFGSFAD